MIENSKIDKKIVNCPEARPCGKCGIVLIVDGEKHKCKKKEEPICYISSEEEDTNLESLRETIQYAGGTWILDRIWSGKTIEGEAEKWENHLRDLKRN